MKIPKHKLPKKSTTAGAARTNATISIYGEPSVVYDLSGSMSISLPARWRSLIGKVAFEECLAELRSRTMTIVSRERGAVVYIRLATTVTELGVEEA
jgi:hypothetical protein